MGYADISSSAHGFDGYISQMKSRNTLLTTARPLAIGLSHVWDHGFAEYFDIITAKYTKNLDHNSGNPIGMSVSQVCALDGRRITASGAFLSPAPTNLTIITDAAVEKVLFEGQKAVGVRVPGKTSQAVLRILLPAITDRRPSLRAARGDTVCWGS